MTSLFSRSRLSSDRPACHSILGMRTLAAAHPRDTVYQLRDSIRIIYKPQPYEVRVEVPRKVTLIEKLLMAAGALLLIIIILKIANYLRV